MSIKIGSISAKDFYVGSTPAKEIRLGSTLIWSREPEEVYYTLTLNGVESEGIKGYSVYINEVLQPEASTYQILKGSFVQVDINADTDYYNYDFSCSAVGNEGEAWDGWYMNEDAVVTVSTSRKYYTLIVNLEGEFYDGYSIYVNDEELARFDSNQSFNIPVGATVRAYNNSSGRPNYEYIESVTPTPNYIDHMTWIMDQDYELTARVSSTSYNLTLNWSEGVDSFTLYFDAGYGWEHLRDVDLSPYINLPYGTKYYIEALFSPGYVSDNYLGTKDDPFILTDHTSFTIDATLPAKLNFAVHSDFPMYLYVSEELSDGTSNMLVSDSDIEEAYFEATNGGTIHIYVNSLKSLNSVEFNGMSLESVGGIVDYAQNMITLPNWIESGTLRFYWTN